MTKNKKPTMMEVKTAINNILVEMSHMSRTMRALDSALASYVEFKGDEKKWRKFVEKKLKEKDGKPVKSSTKGNKKSKKAK